MGVTAAHVAKALDLWLYSALSASGYEFRGSGAGSESVTYHHQALRCNGLPTATHVEIATLFSPSRLDCFTVDG